MRKNSNKPDHIAGEPPDDTSGGKECTNLHFETLSISENKLHVHAVTARHQKSCGLSFTRNHVHKLVPTHGKLLATQFLTVLIMFTLWILLKMTRQINSKNKFNKHKLVGTCKS